MTNLIAQQQQNFNTPLCGIGPLGLCEDGPTQGITMFAAVLSTAIGLLTVVAALYFMFVLITGAIGIISAGEDKTAFEGAKKRITNGFIGLVVTIAAIFLMDVIATLLGIPSILNVREMVNLIRLQ